MSGLAHRPAMETDSRASAYGRVDQRDGDPWQKEETQGSQRGREGGEKDPLGDPWGNYKKNQQWPRENQQSSWGNKH